MLKVASIPAVLIPTTSGTVTTTTTAAAAGTSVEKSTSHRQWARRKKVNTAATRTAQRSQATDDISALAQSKAAYCREKLGMKRQQHELYLREHEKKMKVLDLKEQWFAAKLKKLTEE